MQVKEKWDGSKQIQDTSSVADTVVFREHSEGIQ